MKPDDFEARLARVPLNPPPASWRREILRAAQPSTPAAARARPFGTSLARLLLDLREHVFSPTGLLAGGWALATALIGFNQVLEPTHLENPNPTSARFAATPSRASTLAAARNYQARINALASDDTQDAETLAAMFSSPYAPPARPRSESSPVWPSPPPAYRSAATPDLRATTPRHA